MYTQTFGRKFVNPFIGQPNEVFGKLAQAIQSPSGFNDFLRPVEGPLFSETSQIQELFEVPEIVVDALKIPTPEIVVDDPKIAAPEIVVDPLDSAYGEAK